MAYEIPKHNEQFIFSETLIEPCWVKVMTELCDYKDMKKDQDLALSNDMMTR